MGAFFSLLLASAGCADDGGSTEGTEPDPVDYEMEVQPIWEGNCGCHFNPIGGGDAQAAPDTDLRLNAELALDHLVGMASEDVPDMKRVEPGAPEESYLWRKITDTHLDVGGEGNAMPPSLVLDDDEMDTIERWILGL